MVAALFFCYRMGRGEFLGGLRWVREKAMLEKGVFQWWVGVFCCWCRGKELVELVAGVILFCFVFRYVVAGIVVRIEALFCIVFILPLCCRNPTVSPPFKIYWSVHVLYWWLSFSFFCNVVISFSFSVSIVVTDDDDDADVDETILVVLFGDFFLLLLLLLLLLVIFF